MSYKYEYAGFWLRFGAMIIDSLILFLAIIPAAWIFYRGDYDLVFATGLSSQPQNYLFDLIVNYAFPFLYSVLCWLYFAGTPGKRLMRLKVLDEKTGNKLTVMQSIIRYIGYIPSILVFGIGLFWVAFDVKKQGWHDKMAKTVVVREL
ncbi:RDD family protein [Acinetobacter pittii]|uniref:RDD family protein n=1 Tax=Acinetobacter pittii TaxID=48296 RepID=UPI000708E3F9|nr:RDD family protein [Acinetobacter pittii]KRI53778.1 RDD family protein [Acinetobacter pittii]